MSVEQRHENKNAGDEQRPVNQADLTVTGAPRDTVFLVAAQTESARAWILEHVSEEGYQPWWPDLIVEHRYLKDLVEGARAAGLEVDDGRRPPGERRRPT